MTVNVDIHGQDRYRIRNRNLTQYRLISGYLLWCQWGISLPVTDVFDAHERTCPVRSFACSRCSHRGLLSR